MHNFYIKIRIKLKLCVTSENLGHVWNEIFKSLKNWGGTCTSMAMVVGFHGESGKIQ